LARRRFVDPRSGDSNRECAAVLLAFVVASHIRVATLDLNLFRIALLAYYVRLGADRLSLDRLLSQGLKNSPLPQAGALIRLLDATRPALTGIYLLALRVALTLTLLLAGGHVGTAMTPPPEIDAWLPVSSARLLFGSDLGAQNPAKSMGQFFKLYRSQMGQKLSHR
jgi:hypothetical protein